jgi:hypothetical protein
MYVDAEDGNLVIGMEYIRNAEALYLYPDIIHELVHVKQDLDGRELFDEKYSYADRPTEIEAYQYTVEEARRLGMTEQDIVQYLYVEWMAKDEFARMLDTFGVKLGKDQQPSQIQTNS